MQISTATLLASQQPSPVQAKPAASFTAALEQGDGFSPLPLKLTALAGEPAAVAAPKGPARLGAPIEITV